MTGEVVASCAVCRRVLPRVDRRRWEPFARWVERQQVFDPIGGITACPVHGFRAEVLVRIQHEIPLLEASS